MSVVLVIHLFDGADQNRLDQVVVEVELAVSPGLWRQISSLSLRHLAQLVPGVGLAAHPVSGHVVPLSSIGASRAYASLLRVTPTTPRTIDDELRAPAHSGHSHSRRDERPAGPGTARRRRR